MPAKNKVNYRAAAHSDELMTLAASTHKAVIKGQVVTYHDLDMLIRLATDLSRELRGIVGPQVPSDANSFLTEEPKDTGIDKLPTVKAPVVEVPKEPEPAKKRSFLGS